MKLWAISDLHIGIEANKKALDALKPFPQDWLILAGDICERVTDLEWAFSVCTKKFARVFWVPGNHELWLVTPEERLGGSVAKYESLVEIARNYGVITPEDPWEIFPPTGHVVIPLFTLYDYSFRPDEVLRHEVISWAREASCVCTDEVAINPEPFPSPDHWCRHLCTRARGRFDAELPPNARTVLINHFPLREDVIYIPKAPRFTPWCGTKETEDWHNRYRADVVISGHLHVRRTLIRGEARFEEVSLGYLRQWDQSKGLEHYLRSVI